MADALTTGLRLETTYDPAFGRFGGFELRVVNATATPVVAERLALTSIVPMLPPKGSTVAVVHQVSVYCELATGAPIAVDAGSAVVLAKVWCKFPPFHANDGPASAFLIHADDTTTPLAVAEMVRLPGASALTDPVPTPSASPAPVRVTEPARPVRLDGGGDAIAAVWARMAAAERAVHGDGPIVLGSGPGDADPVTATIDPALGTDAFRLRSGGDVASAVQGAVELVAGGDAGLRRGLSALARARRGEHPPLGRPVYGWRGFHVDVARQWYPAATVTELIEIAGWYGLNRFHLHLTDDEAWRVPIGAYPALTEFGAWRGYGLPIPPLLGTGAARTGGSYTPAEIGAWAATAAGFGIDLIPEIDLPAHSFATLAALPELRDPEDRGGAVSVQGFADNVLNPGVAATMTFLAQVLGEIADLFPGPWIHVGGDEVPADAWMGSPAAQRYAAERGVEGTRGIEGAFMRDVIGLVGALGRQVGVWQEAAECGALQPGEGYAIGWTSNEANRKLAAAGYDVVAAPAQAYYLDMADSTDWSAPGAFWAGVIGTDTIDRFDPAGGWTEAERDHLIGVQACLWSEHVHDRSIMRRLVLPRLATFADRATLSD